MERINVSELNNNAVVESIFLVSEKHLGTGKNGRPFLSMKLSDKTGVIDARMWDRVEDVARLFDVGNLIKIKGSIQIFQNRKQLILHKIEIVQSEEHKLEDFMPEAQSDPLLVYAELISTVATMKNNFLKQLVLDTLEDLEIKPLIMKAPAAKTIHHAWPGGLLDHILSICKLMDFISYHYSFLNRDFLIFGAIFHDIGKIWELEIAQGISYSNKGRLLGHMLMGCELVDKKANRILGFPEELKDLCKHIILSHHGQLAYGSPKRPKFMEAYVVAMVDDFDSKVASIFSLIEMERKQTSDKWSKYSELPDRYFFLDNIKEKYENS